ncbi:hypothetical protein ACU8NH_38825 (plasmid) [Rhizobium leguminosarum]|jgi:hypothetical protein|uniref:4-oxalocrotonate tautomerase n=1 Tax=Rhizobium brockwellii TaxID=3019932 RepID=A0ABU3YYD1_9HYPH|nr:MULTISPECIES: hypothetical protein [Rhizobium]MBY5413653.1 hypothetical protein [Rhizobium leguminosarum]MDV4183843.1 hypothetical protein [Rhizobium brockwellii]MDV4190833.1 hypothetical protein [Rhizobium brockwellii]NZD54994.1 hypothetical protein [Rhizobium leguminosarum]QIO63341.1 hypothetical protein HA463_38205 [Rhizobium leguminosarum bv. trifolii]
MAKITVYRVRRYDIAADDYAESRRLMTEKGARMIYGEIIRSTAVEIDEMDLETGEQWTPIGYVPKGNGGGSFRVGGAGVKP